MKIKFKNLINLSALAIGLMTNLQAQTLRNDMISALGGSDQIENTNLVIHQSIGQSSIIGSFYHSPTILSQGFLRGTLFPPREHKKPFDLIPFPNSFSNQISFRFLHNQIDPTHFIIYDINGKKVYDEHLTPIDNEVLINLDHLAAGLYLAFIQSENRLIQKRIVKIDVF
jgi:hypothetical protein